MRPCNGGHCENATLHFWGPLHRLSPFVAVGFAPRQIKDGTPFSLCFLLGFALESTEQTQQLGGKKWDVGCWPAYYWGYMSRFILTNVMTIFVLPKSWASEKTNQWWNSVWFTIVPLCNTMSDVVMLKKIMVWMLKIVNQRADEMWWSSFTFYFRCFEE